jgi:hypothetical protein
MNRDPRSFKVVVSNLVAAIVVICAPVLIAIHSIEYIPADLSTVPWLWAGIYSFIALMSATKLYGTGVYNSVKGLGESILGVKSSSDDKKE